MGTIPQVRGRRRYDAFDSRAHRWAAVWWFERQRRYRKRLASRKAPEASTVDDAIAASVIGYIDAVEAGLGTAADREVLKLLLRGALDLLVGSGYDRSEAANVVRRRVTRHGRKDLGHWSRRRGFACVSAETSEDGFSPLLPGSESNLSILMCRGTACGGSGQPAADG